MIDLTLINPCIGNNLWRHLCPPNFQILGDTATIAEKTSVVKFEKIGRKLMTKLIDICQEFHEQLYGSSKGETI
jgi:hypothetical protein